MSTNSPKQPRKKSRWDQVESTPQQPSSSQTNSHPPLLPLPVQANSAQNAPQVCFVCCCRQPPASMTNTFVNPCEHLRFAGAYCLHPIAMPRCSQHAHRQVTCLLIRSLVSRQRTPLHHTPQPHSLTCSELDDKFADEILEELLSFGTPTGFT